MSRFLILGSGYVGSRFSAYVRSLLDVHEVFETIRRPEKDRIRFDLADESTWDFLPEVDFTLWTFPAEPRDLVESFFKANVNRLGKLVVIGTTSSFAVPSNPAVVTEDTDVNLEDSRVQGEEFLRNEGAVIVHAAGIYGPERNPLRWVKEGRVGPSSKFVNFIHVEDLVRILYASFERGDRGARYIAADGKPRRWIDLLDQFQKAFSVTSNPGAPISHKPSKLMDASKTLKHLQIQLLYPDVIEGIRSLDRLE